MQHTASERLGLPRVPTRLRAEFQGPPPAHTAIYAAAVNGRIPAIWERGRWYIDTAGSNGTPRWYAQAGGATKCERNLQSNQVVGELRSAGG
jgi:hypothetical protein